jgi:hypothetical protein
MKERGRVEPSLIEPIVERVVGQALESHAAQLRTEIVRRVMEEIAAEPCSYSAVPACSPADLARAVGEIQLGSSQREILRALLDTSARYASRVALFVVKGSHATGWQARGFAYNDAVKDFALDENAPAVVQAIGRSMGGYAVGGHVPASAPTADLDARFLQEFGTPASGEACILPLILKDKVAALVYADGGTGAEGWFNNGALELLVLSASAWLEVNSLRKHAHKEPAHAENHAASSQGVPAAELPWPQAPPPHAGSAYHDPFAVPAHDHAMAAVASAGEVSATVASVAGEVPAMAAETEVSTPELQYSVVEETEPGLVELMPVELMPIEPVLIEPVPPEPLPIGHAESTSPAASEAPPDASISPEDQGIHRKAQRFARLLVDEIKLYNQANVAEGRKNKDLYDRLQEPIEKSRATYQKRYGNTVAASADYFQHEIIRSLAEDDLSIMGANFRH